MQGDHQGQAVGAVQVAQDLHHLAGRHRVEGGHGLVREDDLGPLDQGPGDGAALLLATGQGVGPLGGVLGHADPGEGRHGCRGDLLGPAPEKAPEEGDSTQRTQGDIAEQGQSPHQVELLEDEADPDARFTYTGRDAPPRLDRRTEGLDDASARIDYLQAGNGPEKGGLAGTRRADQSDHLAAADVQGYAVEGPAGAEGPRHVPDRQNRFFSHARDVPSALQGPRRAATRPAYSHGATSPVQPAPPGGGKVPQNALYTGGVWHYFPPLRRTRCPQKRC